jgi:hypothetical protein
MYLLISVPQLYYHPHLYVTTPPTILKPELQRLEHADPVLTPAVGEERSPKPCQLPVSSAVTEMLEFAQGSRSIHTSNVRLEDSQTRRAPHFMHNQPMSPVSKPRHTERGLLFWQSIVHKGLTNF